MEKDLLHIRYDPAKVTPEEMLRAIDKVGYDGKVIQERMRDEG
jgi:hypothetical protein